MDIDNQSAGNYGYDEIGNLKKDVSENIDTVRWTVYGKINRIVKSSGSTVINYGYDAGGNRTTKVVSGTADTTTYYIRDAQGNVLAVYLKKGTDSLKWDEQDLYGSSRLGMWLPDTLPTSPPIVMDGTAIQDSLMIGSRTYELTNHLGNVLSTISDKKIGNDSSGVVNYYIAEVLSQNDYYPFGMLQPERQYSISGYKYGFNGKEQDPETYGQGNIYDYGFRIYNPRLGRFLSIDPLTKKYPWYTPYQFTGNSPIKFIDIDGLEPAISEPSKNKELQGRFEKSRMWAVNYAFNKTGGEKKYSTSPITEATGTYSEVVDKTKFFANKDNSNLNRIVNENSQFIVTKEDAFKTDKDLVNNLLGNFLWGIGPENYVFPENGKFSTELKNSIAVGETLLKWKKEGFKDGIYGWNMGLGGEISVDANSGFTSLEHFLGSVSVKIGRVDDQTIKVEIFNVTSLTSGDIDKDLFGLKPLKSTIRDGCTKMQTDHSNISQFFSFTMTNSEAEKIINKFTPPKDDIPKK